MRLLACTQCGSTLEWDGSTSVVTCRYCGARFQMNSSAGADDWRRAALRDGCVADRPFLRQDELLQGKVFFRSWLPQGWTYNVGVTPLERAMSMATPWVPTIIMTCEKKGTRIRYTTANAFQDTSGSFANPMAGGFARMPGMPFGGMGQAPTNGQMWIDGLVHYPTCTLDPKNYVRSRPLVSAADYCDEIALIEVTVDLQFVQEQNKGNWCRRIYSFVMDDTPCIILTEAQISVGTAMGPMQPRMWQVDYEMSLVCPEVLFQEAFGEFNKVRDSIELGRDFAEMEEFTRCLMMGAAQKAQGAVNNAVMQMQADRNASWDRRNAMMRDKNEYITNTMHQMQASAAATNERVARWNSETIREVNTFASATGPVEASTRWDHVYQGTPGSQFGQDTFLGVEGDWLEPGVDFIELPRI